MTARGRPLVVGNWKMNGLRRDGLELARALAARMGEGAPGDVAVCPPATLLAEVGQAIAGSGMALGGQNCSTHAAGAHTGEISAAMLADVGCRYVILGHSERRSDHGESDQMVRMKVSMAMDAGLCAIVCVGESGAERDAGQTLAVITDQLAGSIPEDAGAKDIVVAYEPVWAIGTGRTPTVAQVEEVHGHIRKHLADRSPELGERVRILYGGSVNSGNAKALLAAADVDGALVGGASLRADEFWSICASAP